MTTAIDTLRTLLLTLREELQRTEAIAHAGAAHASTIEAGDTCARLFETISERLETVDTLNALDVALDQITAAAATC